MRKLIINAPASHYEMVLAGKSPSFSSKNELFMFILLAVAVAVADGED